jgi:hypothetical protein
MSSLKFFLNAKGGSLAFLKEMDSPDWSKSAFLVGLSTGYAPSVEESLNLSSVRCAVILIKPSNPSATYSFKVMGYMESGNIPGWYMVDDGYFSDISGNYAVGINGQLVNRLSIEVVSVSAGSLSVDIAPIPFED